jgi:ABC-type sugar transport system substrate-binding protein
MKLTKRNFVMTALAGVFAMGTGNVAFAQEEPLQIAYLSPSFNISDGWERVYWSMRARLDEQGVKYEVIQLAVQDASDHAGQLAQIESVIERGADYVFLGATEYESAISGLRKLKTANIPVVVYNFLEPHEDETARAMQYIAFDHYEGGRLAGEWSAARLEGKGQVAVLQGVPGVVSDKRMNGFLSVMEKHPDIDVHIGVHTDFDRVKAFEATSNLLAAHPEVDLIYGVSTGVGLGIGQALKAAGLSDQIYSLGFGGTGDEITAMKEGWLSASPLRSIDDSGVAVADAFIANMKGEDVAPSWSGPFVMVDFETDAAAIVAHANRYSLPAMGR